MENEELKAITQRLDHMQGIQLAQQVYLEALGTEFRKVDWTTLMELSQIAEKRLDELRPTRVSDITLHAYQQSISDMLKKLEASTLSGPFGPN